MSREIKSTDSTKGMMLKNGQRHSECDDNGQCGIPAVVNETGQKIEIEQGEVIINRKSVNSNKELTVKGTPKEILSTINQLDGNGVPIGDEEAEILAKYKNGGKVVSDKSEVKVLGFSDEVTECDRCGRNELKGTYNVLINGEVYNLGTSCIAKKMELTNSQVRTFISNEEKRIKKEAREELDLLNKDLELEAQKIRNNDTTDDLHYLNDDNYRLIMSKINKNHAYIKNKYGITYFKQGGKIPNFSNMSKSEIKDFYDSPEGKKLDAETYKDWSNLVNMSKSELEEFYNSELGKKAGLSKSEADEQGISSGRESAKWILKMKDIPYTKWTPDMWRWAKKQISFIKRMSGAKGDLRDENNKPTRKLLALKIWGNNPEKFNGGGLIAPNGNKSNLTPNQYKLVRKPEFKAWFGDWENDPKNASKVVDENGEPLVVYHGTNQEFTIFDLNKVGSNVDYGMWGSGFYFSPSRSFSKGYGDKLMKLFLNIRNPFIKNPEKRLGSNEFKPVIGKEKSIELRDKFLNNNYDGVMQWDSGNKNPLTQIVAFEPNQIKLANGTNTTFDVNNNDIRFRNGGELKNNYMIGKQLSLMDDDKNEDYRTLDIFQGTEVETFAKGGGVGENQASYSIREVNNWDEIPVRWKNTSKINKVSYKVDPKDKGLNDLMSKIVGNDMLRPAFSGINFDDNGATSTDAHKLLSIPAETEFRGVYKTLKSIEKTKGTDLIDAKYPNYQAVIPKEFRFIYKANLYKLLQYCKVALNYANKTTYQIGLRVNEEMNIGLNAKFTIDIVSSFIAMGYDNAYFHFSEPSRAVVVSNDENPTLGKSTIGLVMPVMLNIGRYPELGAMDIDFNLYLKPYFDFEKNEILNSDGSVADFKMNYGEDDVFTKEIVGIIKSITPSNSKIYILENFIVKNKTIKVTDLEDSVEIKNIDVPDGIYRIENDAVIQYSLSDDINDYPKIAIIEDYDTIKINKDFFKWAIEKTKNYVGKDDLRPVMTGINIQKKGDLLSITSTDAHLLATIDSTKYIKLNGIENDFSITVTPKNLFEAVKLMDSEEIEIAFSKDRYSDGALKGSMTVKFVCDDIVYTTLSVQGKYPNYRAVIPYMNPKSLLVNMRDIKSIVNSKEAKDFISKNKKGADLIKIYGSELDGNINISIEATKGGYKQETQILGDKFLGKVGYDYDYETVNGETCSLIMPVMKNEGVESNIFTFNAVLFGKFLDNLDGEILELGFSEPSKAYLVGERNLFYTESKIKVKPKVKKQIEKGIKVEEEHRGTLEDISKGKITVDEAIEQTVSDHLSEDENYYDKLEVVEGVNKSTSIKELIEALEILEETELVEALKLLDDGIDNDVEVTKGYFEVDSNNTSFDNVKIINDYFNKWTKIKSEKDSEDFKKLNPPMFGTYNSVNIIEQIEKFEGLDIPIYTNKVVANQFKKELNKIIQSKLSNKQTFAKGGEMKTSKSMFFEPNKSDEEEEKRIMENQFGKNI